MSAMYPTLSYVLQQASAHVLATCPEHVPGCKCPPIVTPGSAGTVELEVAGVPVRVTVEAGVLKPHAEWCMSLDNALAAVARASSGTGT